MKIDWVSIYGGVCLVSISFALICGGIGLVNLPRTMMQGMYPYMADMEEKIRKDTKKHIEKTKNNIEKNIYSQIDTKEAQLQGMYEIYRRKILTE